MTERLLCMYVRTYAEVVGSVCLPVPCLDVRFFSFRKCWAGDRADVPALSFIVIIFVTWRDMQVGGQAHGLRL